MSIDQELKFDEEGFHYFVDSGSVAEAEGYNFVSYAYIHKDKLKSRLLYIQFRDGYLADFESENVAKKLDERLRRVQGVENIFWEDRELFNITYKEGQRIPELIKKIDKKMTDLSKLVK